MADRTGNQEPARQVVIPDGGLGATLPDWMQAKPEWTDREQVEAAPIVRDRPVPAPDTSPIVLADILTVDDMPGWLRTVAERPVTEDVAAVVASEAKPAAVAFATTTVSEAVESSATPSPAHPWWASDRMMAGLLIAVILTILFVLFTAIRLM